LSGFHAAGMSFAEAIEPTLVKEIAMKKIFLLLPLLPLVGACVTYEKETVVEPRVVVPQGTTTAPPSTTVIVPQSSPAPSRDTTIVVPR